MKVLALDTETTGLDIIKHEIIQVGFIWFTVEDEKIISIDNKAEINIRPKNIKFADPFALKINGYTKEKWINSKPFIYYAKNIKTIIESADCLMGQNLMFDLRFINNAFSQLQLIPPKYPKYIDTKIIASKLVNEGKLKSSSMDNMCSHYDIKFKGKAHTALVDCERTISVWQKLIKENKETDFQYFKNKR